MRRLLVLTAVLAISVPIQGIAQAKKDVLAGATLEELMDIEVTSVGRKEQRAEDVAASIFVITQDDIRRSGITTLPELFRMAPGVQVARINANQWAIGVRGFNDLFSNKLLVLVDGRSIYNRSFSGVFWDSQTLLLEDIDRIEVIRGPGASVWGANAVNGVINILTKSAHDTQGGFVRLEVGGHDRAEGAVRYGGTLGAAAYRVYSQWSNQGHSVGDDGAAAGDDGRSFTGGFRIDAGSASSGLTLFGGFTAAASRPLWSAMAGPTPGPAGFSHAVSHAHTGHLLAGWTTTRAGGGRLEVRSFLTVAQRTDFQFEQHEQIADVDVDYHRSGTRHDVVVGGGYRYFHEATAGGFVYSVSPAHVSGGLLNAFAQDDIGIGRGLTLTLGGKLDHDSQTAWGFQPTVRLMQQLPRRQRVWGGFSHAIRRPSLNDLMMTINYAAFTGPTGTPILLRLVGNPQYRSEALDEVEAGYRIGIGARASMDVVAFRGNYDGLATLEPLAPRFEATPAPAHLVVAAELRNLLEARTAGVEISGQWQPLPAVRLDGWYSGFHITPRPDATSHDTAAARFDGNAPRQQWHLGSVLALGPRAEGSVGLYRVGRLGHLNVPAYTRVDARIELTITPRLSIAGSGQNLLTHTHVEFSGAEIGMAATRIPRTGHVRLTWRF